MNDEQVFELAEKIGFQDDFGRWNFTSEGLLDFVFMVQTRGIDGIGFLEAAKVEVWQGEEKNA
jgi:hemerythrin superfamily protein